MKIPVGRKRKLKVSTIRVSVTVDEIGPFDQATALEIVRRVRGMVSELERVVSTRRHSTDVTLFVYGSEAVFLAANLATDGWKVRSVDLLEHDQRSFETRFVHETIDIEEEEVPF
jgi:hypothetical protein